MHLVSGPWKRSSVMSLHHENVHTDPTNILLDPFHDPLTRHMSPDPFHGSLTRHMSPDPFHGPLTRHTSDLYPFLKFLNRSPMFSNLWSFLTFSNRCPMTSLKYALTLNITNKSATDLRIRKGCRFENTFKSDRDWNGTWIWGLNVDKSGRRSVSYVYMRMYIYIYIVSTAM
jgi:hypothetical protein